MEEEKKLWDYNGFTIVFIEIRDFVGMQFSYISSVSSNPLFSSIVTLYALILLYFPQKGVEIIFSPILISTGILLLTLLRLGAIQRNEHQETKEIEEAQQSLSETPEETELRTKAETCSDESSPCLSDTFWNVRAPLEVIYEEYEGEEEEEAGEDRNVSREDQSKRQLGLEKYPSLSLNYPESDSESSSDGDFPAINGWDSPESLCFKWDEEDREELIEIKLDGKRQNLIDQLEEDNLIEIDISPERD
ncbi:hypothetical protein RJ641_002108 [Dillenia turbinata]|uniref:Uncharacterized protein n=1 Tax=Dillenia turbinata TaxID=194707 RepID=A0AAN8VFE3_9MAGN